jgi:hypothetical protein
MVLDLREENARRAKADEAFLHPDYPEPYSRYESDKSYRYELAKDLAVGDSPSDGDNPFGSDAEGWAKAATDHYRSVVPYPSWNNRIAFYPSSTVWDANVRNWRYGPDYAHVECTTGAVIEWQFGLVLDWWELRVFCGLCVSNRTDPQEIAWRIRKKEFDNNDPTRYLLGIAKRLNGGVLPRRLSSGRGNYDLPLVEVQRPDLRIEGWSFGVPEYDKFFVEESPIFKEYLIESGIGLPSLSVEDWLTYLNSNVDPIRAKAKAKKVMR